MRYSHRRITEGLEPPLPSLPRHRGAPFTAPEKPSESHNSRDPKQRAASIKEQSSDNNSSLLFYVYTDYFALCFVPFLPPQQQQRNLQKAAKKKKNPDRAALRANSSVTASNWRQGCNPQMGFTKKHPTTYLEPSAPAC